jgi:hypothetical protein
MVLFLMGFEKTCFETKKIINWLVQAQKLSVEGCCSNQNNKYEIAKLDVQSFHV